MTSAIECSLVNSRKENKMFHKKTTEIVLSAKNLTALMFSMKVVQTLFGQDIIFKGSTLRKSDNTKDEYEITVCAVMPMWTTNFDCSTFFTSVVSFSLNTADSPQVEGDVRVEFVNGFRTQDEGELVLRSSNGELTPTARSQYHLDELRQRIAPYRQPR